MTLLHAANDHHGRSGSRPKSAGLAASGSPTTTSHPGSIGHHALAVPDHVARVMAECKSVTFEPFHISPYPPCHPLNPIVICVLKDEIIRIPDFLRHYRCAGIERFVFIDNGSTDGTLDYLRQQPDVDVYCKSDHFHWVVKQGWINRVVQIYGHERWYIYADADEQIVFQEIGRRTFVDVTREMERRGVRRVRGFLLDMYAAGPLVASRYDGHGPLLDAYPYFDLTGYRERKFTEIISVKGGPRVRVFGKVDRKFSPELTKYPLFRLNESEYMANPHHIWPFDHNFDSARYLAILHFKFLPDITRRIQKAVEQGNYWNGSFEYRCYARGIEAEPDLSLVDAESKQFRSAEDLLALGLIVPIGWAERLTRSAGMQVAFRRSRAALLASVPMRAAAGHPRIPPPLPGERTFGGGERIEIREDSFIGFLPEPGVSSQAS